MFEIGDGVDQDFHLAKRFYDQAAEFDLVCTIYISI
jgi:TPR repeat protein